jgi:orotate phosphoribosyltransferase
MEIEKILERQFQKIKFKSNDIKLSSGRHTDIFYDFFHWTPDEWHMAGEALGQRVLKNAEDHVFVVTPAIGGIIVGYEVARFLNKPLFVFDKDKTFRPYNPPKGRYIIVDDVTSSFTTVKKIWKTLEQDNCVAVASLVHRGGADGFIDTPQIYLHHGEVEE